MRNACLAIGFCLFAVVFEISACSKKEAEPAPEPIRVENRAPLVQDDTTFSKPELIWSDPPAWKRHPPSNGMRIAEYVVPKASGDAEDAECVVSHFGHAGDLNANIDRWIRQFDPKNATSPERSTRTVAGMNVSLLEMSGTYSPAGMPGGPPSAPKPNSRMLAAAVEAPSGLWYFKLTGPDATVKAAKSAFNALVDSVQVHQRK